MEFASNLMEARHWLRTALTLQWKANDTLERQMEKIVQKTIWWDDDNDILSEEEKQDLSLMLNSFKNWLGIALNQKYIEIQQTN